ncbi:hypothetical protein DY000_02030388 [Brassica cretica]|uniref:Uncharacterized protein n=1 Tax=Brassica cretica TaxID=69181 RepID=A0ABQ7DMV5_BRACR|nr:hypothetical protein DY000_02030388 [Brassica cretica]
MAGWPIRVCDGGRESFCPSARSSGSLWDQIESEKSTVILDGGPNAGQRKQIWTWSMPMSDVLTIAYQWAGSVCMLEKAEDGCRAVQTGFGTLSMTSVLSVLDDWLETKPSLFVYLDHVGMLAE